MNKTQLIVRTGLLLALTLVIQFLRLPQYLTGPLINFMLILSTILISHWSGIIIGTITPYIAFTMGILAAPLAPIIPFIMVGNAVYVIIFSLLRRINRFFGVVGGSLLKFLILAAAVRFVVEVPPPVAQAMQLPQLITALVGGLVAVIAGAKLRERILSDK